MAKVPHLPAKKTAGKNQVTVTEAENLTAESLTAEGEVEAQSEAASASSIEPEIVDFEAEAIGEGGGQGDQAGGEVSSPFYSQAEFFAFQFVMIFKGVNVLLYMRRKITLETFDKIASNPLSAEAAGVLYEIILENEDLHFLIRKDDWTRRIMVLGAFGVSVGSQALEELKAMSARDVTPENDNEAGEGLA